MNTQDIEDIYELSPMQQGILFHSVDAPQSGIYCMRLSYALRGNLDIAAFASAWQHIVDRHTILRTSFHWHDTAKPLQVVHTRVGLEPQLLDLRHLSRDEQRRHVDAHIDEEGRKGFDFGVPPLMRLALFRCADEVYYFVWTFHHLLLDGECKSLVLKEVFEVYEMLRRGRPLAQRPRRRYRDYILWLQQQNLAGAEEFWRKELAGFKRPTPLAVDRLSDGSAEGSQAYDTRHTRLSGESTAALQTIARRHHLTLNTLMQGVWAVLLSRYSGEDDVLFGATVSNRPVDREGFEHTPGLFINTLPVRVRVDSKAPLLAWLADLQAHQADARQYDYAPLMDIQGWSEVPRGRSLFESVLAFENSLHNEQQADGLDVQFERASDWSNYPLTLEVLPGAELLLGLIYDTRRFDNGTIARMLDHLETLLQGIINCPEGRLAELPLLTDEERRQLLVEWNDTASDYPEDKTLPELFEMQVQRTPDAVAVAFEDRRFTYRELNKRANQLAHHLSELGVGPEVLVGLFVERSPEMVVGILGILKAGGAYLPLDPSYPTERLAFMLQDARVAIVLSQQRLLQRWTDLSLPHVRQICLDTDWKTIAAHNDADLSSRSLPENLAYVIYTSGSTGWPKGAMVRHRGLINYLTWCERAYPVALGQGAVVHSSIAFDLTVTGLFAPLLQGRRVTLAPEELGMEGLSATLSRERDLSLVKITPAHLQLLGQQLSPEQAAGRTRAFIIGGENLLPEHIAFWREHAPDTALINEYGPTETVVGCCVYQAGDGDLAVAPVPVGRPIINTQLYILDRHLRPVPIGVMGELYIGGAGVARGYLNRPDLTAERFLPDPFSAEPGARMYESGDLARYLADGNIECRGRVDHQVKIRGFRIELGEIESVLSQHPAIRESAVIVREDTPGDRILVAYVATSEGASIAPPDLRAFLKRKLPDYMVPAFFVALDALPLTTNGKVDRSALPVPDPNGVASPENYEAPRTETESLIASIWREVLHVEYVGVQDNFFDLGGHSLLCLPVMAKLEKELGVRISPRDLIFQTLGQLATACEERWESPHAVKPVGLKSRMINAIRRAVS
jgi:surfactin family lipopeptide synthetase C